MLQGTGGQDPKTGSWTKILRSYEPDALPQRRLQFMHHLNGKGRHVGIRVRKLGMGNGRLKEKGATLHFVFSRTKNVPCPSW